MAVIQTGSSPHARGTQSAVAFHDDGCGIIPACAGNTWARSSNSSAPWDHPRMRGEHRVAGRRLRVGGGSSPHARGTRVCNVSSFR